MSRRIKRRTGSNLSRYLSPPKTQLTFPSVPGRGAANSLGRKPSLKAALFCWARRDSGGAPIGRNGGDGVLPAYIRFSGLLNFLIISGKTLISKSLTENLIVYIKFSNELENSEPFICSFSISFIFFYSPPLLFCGFFCISLKRGCCIRHRVSTIEKPILIKT